MAAKTIQVSADGISNWLTLPGNSADFSAETNQLEDTIFGNAYNSNFPGLISWSVSTNALFRGIAGYCAKVLKTGTPTAFTAEATTQVGSSLVYEITDRAKSVWNWEEAVIVLDDGIAVDPEDIERIVHVQGQVEFVSGYVPDGPITVTGEYLPLSAFARANTISLTQTSDVTDTTDFETACANGGYITQRPTLLDADLELSGFYRPDNELYQLLRSRTQFVIEIDPKGDGESTARGIYRPASDSQTGDVGGDENETFGMVLSVPDGVVPFAWRHTSDSTIPAAIVLVQNAWGRRETIYVRYLPEGVGEEGREGEVIVTDISLEVSVDGLPEFSVTLDGTGEAEIINA